MTSAARLPTGSPTPNPAVQAITPPPGARGRGAERRPLRRAQAQAGARSDERQPAESAEKTHRRQLHLPAGHRPAEHLDEHDANGHAGAQTDGRRPDP